VRGARLHHLDTPSYFLGEGPVWTPPTETLSWSDIDDGLVLSAAYSAARLGEITTLQVGGPVGCAIPISRGRFLVSLEAWLGILHPNGRLEHDTGVPGTDGDGALVVVDTLARGLAPTPWVEDPLPR
jgi:sugar lactone lactonase YvrE